MPDVMKIGGVTSRLRTAALAEPAGLPLVSHIFPEISAHLLAASPTTHRLKYLDLAGPILSEASGPATCHFPRDAGGSRGGRLRRCPVPDKRGFATAGSAERCPGAPRRSGYLIRRKICRNTSFLTPPLRRLLRPWWRRLRWPWRAPSSIPSTRSARWRYLLILPMFICTPSSRSLPIHSLKASSEKFRAASYSPGATRPAKKGGSALVDHQTWGIRRYLTVSAYLV